MAEEQEQAAPMEVTPAEPVKLDLNSALEQVLKNALIHDGLARGLHEGAKALDKRQVHLCVLANNCDEPAYGRLVEALCAEHNIPLVKVEDKKELGRMVGLCKIDKDGNPRKVVGCSCVVVKDFGEETEAVRYVLQHIKKN